MGQLPCFDELKELANRDPQAFDRFRQDVCEEFINSIPRPHRRRLKAVQFRVDHEIRRAKTPMAGLIKVSGMMHDSLYQLSTRLYDLKHLAFNPTADWPRPPLAEVVYIDRWRFQRQIDKGDTH